ncbi:10302_t:CDS:2 [Cetraspora pellucida]|uniref:10302_t:CDS:1 n=1 Tax=Cetraspora pellucida TaxID=1433469 RepID=A0A9N9FAE5_9GLOM|nr:10302_t:CDS:2 [Cetraspora pellucida]
MEVSFDHLKALIRNHWKIETVSIATIDLFGNIKSSEKGELVDIMFINQM